MNENALLWYEDFIKGRKLMQRKPKKLMDEAYELFTRSARSFPDYYIAAEY